MPAFYQIHGLRDRELIGEPRMTKTEAEEQLQDWFGGDVLTEEHVQVLCFDLDECRVRDVTEDFLDDYRARNAEAYMANAEANAADLARGL